jgi:hypothetical protein
LFLQQEPPIKITDLFNFKLPFWLLSVSCLVIYGTVIPFNNNASTFLQIRDFMPTTSTWHGNVSYIAPLCDGGAPVADHLVSRSCGEKANYYLGPAFAGATFGK